ncbi:V-type ATPase subunit [Methanocella conradii]|uniref:V-type ATPase subunit n=1 Tax=Methanocella conradii TaxID=1175444 RepID=UPI0024B36896|nr:V-type ATPase subunit [Methanocella conradii]MDI6897842.1 V-type ATPase subunit [Methanocella conradii]
MDYGYLNARIRGMKGRLLDRKALDDLVLKPDVDSLTAAMEKTPYRQDVEEAGVKYSGVYRLEYALRRNFTRTFTRISELVRGEDGEKYLNVFLKRWDVQNVKTILRGKSIHAASEEIFECLLPVGSLDEASLSEMIKQPDVKSVIDLMAAWDIEYARPLMQAFSQYQSDKSLIPLDVALDRYHYEQALGSLKKNNYDAMVVRELLATQIDIINIKSALRMVRDKVSPEEAKVYFIEGGKKLDEDFLLSMINAKSVEGALKLLEPTHYSFLKSAPEESLKKEKISDLEKMLDKYLILKGISAYRGDPLSIAILVGFFWAKYNEVTNLRIIARCKTVGMSEEQVRKELIYA